ncbi:hypothetical protein RM533_04615 [Croceicoccus sp. F390]|uniref:Uncharacterized protein n=1 Tax=Croceicoccus esteveae TaxID=3075597 RepID=A0ABU2ZGC7_9SPHN|nr:hypothetical protein [Croceicoccus sp. F390]MDT0575460.1 hypothetical protein [Croceicoccus sp. F390]
MLFTAVCWQELGADEIAQGIRQCQNTGWYAAFGTANDRPLSLLVCAKAVPVNFDDGGINHGVFSVGCF